MVRFIKNILRLGFLFYCFIGENWALDKGENRWATVDRHASLIDLEKRFHLSGGNLRLESMSRVECSSVTSDYIHMERPIPLQERLNQTNSID
jgi:hypothetical protein